MELKNLLNISFVLISALIMFACTEPKEKTQVGIISDKFIEKQVKIDSNAINKFVSNDTTLASQDISILINIDSINSENDTTLFKKDKVHSKTELNITNQVIDEGTEPNDKENVHNGTEYTNDLYIVDPLARARDSINLFVHMYEKLIRTLTKKGISNPIERDSLLWVHWQEVVNQRDYRHKYEHYNRNYKWGTE